MLWNDDAESFFMQRIPKPGKEVGGQIDRKVPTYALYKIVRQRKYLSLVLTLTFSQL